MLPDGARQTSVFQVRVGKVCTCQIRARQVRAAQIGAGYLGVRQFNLPQVGAGQIAAVTFPGIQGFRELCVVPGEVQPTKAGMTIMPNPFFIISPRNFPPKPARIRETRLL